jgi:DnaJ-class molecular chaperone
MNGENLIPPQGAEVKMKKCEHCDGTGFEKIVCNECKTEITNIKNYKVGEHYICLNCGEIGELVPEELCIFCLGEGEVEKDYSNLIPDRKEDE